MQLERLSRVYHLKENIENKSNNDRKEKATRTILVVSAPKLGSPIPSAFFLLMISLHSDSKDHGR